MTQDCTTKKHAATGRPKDLSKRASIFDAARHHFLRHGFDRASMDAIAAEAGVSKLTIYSHFGNKETLFQELIESECCKHNLMSDCFEALVTLSARDGLTQLAMNFVELIFRPDVIELHRIIIAEAMDKPAISRLFYDAGPEKVVQASIVYFQMLHGTGQLVIDDFRHATYHFYNLLKGDPYFRCLLNLTPAPSEQEVRAHALNVVEMFLRAYAPK